MKLLLENWRKYLNEGIVSLENWPAGYEIEILKNPYRLNPKSAYSITLYDQNAHAGSANVDEVNIEKPEEEALYDVDNCHYELFESELYTVHIDVDEEYQSQGFGPFLMDIAFELAYLDKRVIIPAKLVGGAGTKGAERLYDFYYNNRADVEKVSFHIECWEYYTGKLIDESLPESFLALYRKQPTILNSEMAKRVITIK